MKIRPALPADRQRILDILTSTARFTAQEIGWAMELVDLAFAGRKEYEIHVIEGSEDSGVRGSTTLPRTPEPSPPGSRDSTIQGYVCFGPTPKSVGVFDLYWIAVDAREQGRGFGQLLLRFVENEVRRQNGRMLLIETSSKQSYAKTLRFYESAGYEEISRIKDFYRIEDDKVVFCKHLGQP